MKVERKLRLLVLLFVAILLTQNASAALLPTSSHYEGSTSFGISADSGFLVGQIDFAVYDTLDGDGDEFAAALGDTAPGTGQFIYAYQIQLNNFTTGVVDYFSVLEIGQGAIDDPLIDIDSVSDSSDPAQVGIDATDSYFSPTLTEGIWEFEYGGQHLVADEHSFFLVMRSNQDWKEGDYTFERPEDEDEFPVPNIIPEPATITLLALGCAALIRKK